MGKVITEQMKADIVSFYLTKPMTIDAVAQKYGLCGITIRRILGDTPIYSRTQIFNPNLRESFFSTIDSEEKAYFLGLIIADGNIYDPTESSHKGSKWVSITLDDDDKYMLERFKSAVQCSSKVASDGRGSSYVAIRSNIMANDLKKYGVVPRKSFITRFPFEVDPIFYRHIMRGIIDGDGSVQAYSHYTEKDNRNRFRHKIACCGTHKLMEEMIEVINKNITLNHELSVYDYKTRVLSEFKVSEIGDMLHLGKWLYDDSTVFLDRKKFAFDNFVKHYNL